MSSTPPPTPAGWYTDPGGSGQLRWWDGAAWTAHLAAPPTPAPAATPVVQSAYGSQDVGIQSFGSSAYGSTTLTRDMFTRTAFEPIRPTHWNTAAVWVLVFSDLLILIVYSIALSARVISIGTTGSTIALVCVQIVIVFLRVILAYVDRNTLRLWGFSNPASPWWMLLWPPLLYLIVRTSRVRREVRRGGAPLWTYLATLVVIVLLAVVAVPVFVVQQEAAARTTFVASLTRGLDSRGANYAVSCPPDFSFAIGSHFTCTVQDATSQVAHTLAIEVVAGPDGKPTVKLDSVTPPITN